MGPEVFLSVLLAGIVAGIIGAIFGIGGGLILVPVFVLLYHLPMHQAVAASIIAVIATSSASATVYVEKGISNIRLGMSLEIATVVGAIAGGLVANAIPGELLRKIFAVFLVCLGVFMWIRSRNHGEGRIVFDPSAHISGVYRDDAIGSDVRYSVRRLNLGMLVSIFAGNVSGMLGVGGGIVKVPVMNVLCGVPIKAATATSNFMIGVTAVASAVIYLSHGHVEPHYTAGAVLGVLGGSLLGTRISARLHSRTILGLFILLMFLTALRMYF